MRSRLFNRPWFGLNFHNFVFATLSYALSLLRCNIITNCWFHLILQLCVYFMPIFRISSTCTPLPLRICCDNERCLVRPTLEYALQAVSAHLLDVSRSWQLCPLKVSIFSSSVVDWSISTRRPCLSLWHTLWVDKSPNWDIGDTNTVNHRFEHRNQYLA